MKKVTICHKCGCRDGKVKPVKGGYQVHCPCGNAGLNIKKTIASALASWHSGYQQCDRDIPK